MPSSLGEWYEQLWQLPVSLEIGGFSVFSHNGHTMTLMQFINDALMVIFFFTVGLEISLSFNLIVKGDKQKNIVTYNIFHVLR